MCKCQINLSHFIILFRHIECQRTIFHTYHLNGTHRFCMSQRWSWYSRHWIYFHWNTYTHGSEIFDNSIQWYASLPHFCWCAKSHFGNVFSTKICRVIIIFSFLQKCNALKFTIEYCWNVAMPWVAHCKSGLQCKKCNAFFKLE